VVAPAQRSPAAEARAHKQKSQAVAKKLKLKMIFKKVQDRVQNSPHIRHFRVRSARQVVLFSLALEFFTRFRGGLFLAGGPPAVVP
jgi:hypothetical protein